ncbi:helical backbone metal receptor [Cryomorphaceae bacterium 1068]|nr:helical backbone metal receptor [Cryomorphaceae bacterium 1068]
MKILDQIGRELQLEKTPHRIVSLVPSITELAYDLGFEVIGKTKFCVHPKSLGTAVNVGGTKNVKVDLVKELEPDLILANKEENTKPTVEKLMEVGLPVFISDVSTIDQSVDLIEKLGEIGRSQANAQDLIEIISKGFKSIPKIEPRPKVLYLIWREPYMAAGTDTYISDLMSHLSLDNVLSDWGEKGLRYPEIAQDQITQLKPDFILLSSEPYPFKESQRKSICSAFGIPTLLVDGECFSWYGSRQAKSIDYLEEFSRLLRN